MNTKWFSGIGLAVLLGTGALIYTTKIQARQTAATSAAKPDATLENLTTCATEKNPAYLESVLKGAMNAFDKDAKAALKAGKPAEFKKANKNLLKVIKFLFAQSKHFSPIYKDAAHKPAFDKDIDKVIQKLLKAEYALAKSQSAQKEVIKDYTLVVAELEKDGVENLTPIAEPKETKSVLSKLKDGLGKAGHAVKNGASKAVAKAKASPHAQKALMGAGAAAIGGGGAAAIAKAAIQSDDETPVDDANADAPADDANADAPDDDAPADDAVADAPADVADADAPADDVADADADADDADADAPADLESEDAGTFEPEEDTDAPADDEEAPNDDDSGDDADAPADDEEAPNDDDSGDDADAPADDADADESGEEE